MAEKCLLYYAFKLFAETRNSLGESFQYSVVASGLI